MISQHRFRYWLGAVRQQAITWANVYPDLCRHLASLGHNAFWLNEVLITLSNFDRRHFQMHIIKRNFMCFASNCTQFVLSNSVGHALTFVLVMVCAKQMTSHYLNQRMMTSSNGNIFRVNGPLWGEFTGDRWIPHTKARDTELWCFFLSVPE